MSIVRDIETEDLAEMLEISKNAVLSFARIGMPHRMVDKTRKRYFNLQEAINWLANNERLSKRYTYYAWYEKDELIVIGKVEDIAEHLGLSTQTVIKYINPNNRKKSKKGYSCIKLIHQGENEMEIKIPTTEHKRFRVRANIKRQLDKHKVMVDEALKELENYYFKKS